MRFRPVHVVLTRTVAVAHAVPSLGAAHLTEFWVVAWWFAGTNCDSFGPDIVRGRPLRHSAMSSPCKPHAHGEPTAHESTTSNAVVALPSMPHAHEKNRQSCDEGHLVKLQNFLAKVDQNPKRLEKMIAARRKCDGLSTPDNATSRDTSNQAPASFVTGVFHKPV